MLSLIVAPLLALSISLYDERPEGAVDAREHFNATTATLGGNRWRIEKYLEGTWQARLLVDGEERVVFGDAGPSEDWIRFYLWPDSGTLPLLLFVHRVAGGSNGQETISVVKLSGDFPVIFDGEGFSFEYLADLGDGGYPELVGRSNRFDHNAYAVEMGEVDRPMAPLVLSCAPGSGRYYPANGRYPHFFAPKLKALEKQFHDVNPAGNVIPAAVVLPESREGDSYKALIALLHWAVYAAYADDLASGTAIIDAHCDPILAAFTNQFLRMEFQGESWLRGGPGYLYLSTPIEIQDSVIAPE